MHCPDCGTRATANQKFCRSCGFSLEKVARLLAEQSSLPASSQISDDNIAPAQRRLDKLEGWLCLAAGGFLITVDRAQHRETGRKNQNCVMICLRLKSRHIKS
jgi:hypothetical protein